MCAQPSWLDASELRIGLGCMRLEPAHAADTIAAAARAGVTVFDTAHAYGDDLGGGERMLAAALRACGAETSARIVTKGGMTRPDGQWVPDGRAKAIVADCEASVEALGGLPIELFLLHAPDPRTPWATSVRALARLVDEGLVRRVGVCNVTRPQLDEALELAPIAAVEVSLSIQDDQAIRGGLLERCAERSLALIAHSPLGGPRRSGRLAQHDALGRVAKRHGASPAEVALAWLLGLSEVVVAIPGARRPETARSAARAATLRLNAEDRAELAPAPAARPSPRRRQPDAEVVVIMGIQGAGKSELAGEYTERGYLRLNRDERGGKLRGLAGALDDGISAGADRVVLDNTYLTRAARSYVIEVAHRHGVPARCVWLDIPLAQAQINLVQRMVERFGELPSPETIRALAQKEAGVMSPTSQMRSLRELEPPSLDEGFAEVERVPYARRVRSPPGRPAVFVAASALRSSGWKAAGDAGAPHLIFDWDPGALPDALRPLQAALAREVSGPVETALCPHGNGPPRCWCRPPLPGLPLAFAHRHGVDPAASLLIGTSTAHRTLAAALGARHIHLA